MRDPARKPATYQDVLNAPEHLIAEILDGVLYTHPRPGPRHASTSSLIGMELSPFVRRRARDGGPDGRWRILDEPELHLEAEIVVPDLAGWRWERMPHLPKEAFFTLPPDWVCEVLSPRTEQTDRSKKMRTYARHRVEHLWLVDPVVQTLEVFRLAGEFWQQLGVHAGLEKVRVPPFEEVEIDLGGWWEEDESETRE